MVETLFFDLDNTLLDFNRAERAAIAKTLESFHIAPEPSVLKRYSELNLAQWKLLEQGKIMTNGPTGQDHQRPGKASEIPASFCRAECGCTCKRSCTYL